MTEPRSYAWSYLLSWGLTISGGALAVVSVLAYFLPASMVDPDATRLLCVIAFAAMVGFSVACANCTAAAAQHAISRRRKYPAVLWPALLCTLGFCLASGIGVHLGWALMTQGVTAHDLPDAWVVNSAAIFIALAKPAMNWIIEGRKGIDRDDAAEAQIAEDARLDAARQRDRDIAQAHNVTHLPRTRRVTAGAAAIIAAASLGAPHDAAEAAPLVQTDTPEATQQEAATDAPTKAPRTRLTALEKKRQEATRLLLENVPGRSNRQIAKMTSLSASTIDRIARALSPLEQAA